MNCPEFASYDCFTFSRSYLTLVQSLLKEAHDPWRAGETAFFNGFIGLPVAAGERLDRESVLRGLGPRDEIMSAPQAQRPDQVNLATVAGGAYVSPVQYQGFCGACTAFGVTAAMETFVRINYPDQQGDIKLSEAHLFFAGAGESCWCGWDTQLAVEFAAQNSIVREDEFPYTAYNQPSPISSAAAGVKIKRFDVVTSVEEMKAHLAAKRPLIAVIDFNPDLFLYAGGVYCALPYPEPEEGSPDAKIHKMISEAKAQTASYKHCLCCVGYDDEKQAWLCKNSFGTQWGCQPGEPGHELGGGYLWIGYEEYGIHHLMYVIQEVELSDGLR